MDIQIRPDSPVPSACPAVGHQSVAVCVPVTVEPFARAGTVVTKCCGNAIIRRGSEQQCMGIVNGICKFTITQNICVEVPFEFGADTNIGETYVNCMETVDPESDICANCKKPDDDDDNEKEDEDYTQIERDGGAWQ